MRIFPSVPYMLLLPGATYYALMMDAFPDHLGSVIGLLEAVAGLGYVLGPVFGAALFEWGGFLLPFLVLGAFPAAACLLLAYMLNCRGGSTLTAHASSSCGEAGGKGGRRSVSWLFVYVCLATMLSTTAIAFFEPCLARHLMQHLQVDVSTSGMLQGALSLAYIIAAPLGGWLGEAYGHRLVLVLGLVVFAFALALLGPVPLVPIPDGDMPKWIVQVGYNW